MLYPAPYTTWIGFKPVCLDRWPKKDNYMTIKYQITFLSKNDHFWQKSYQNPIFEFVIRPHAMPVNVWSDEDLPTFKLNATWKSLMHGIDASDEWPECYWLSRLAIQSWWPVAMWCHCPYSLWQWHHKLL